MTSIGIFFGTDTGRTRLIAKQIAKKLGELAAAPVNIGKAKVEDLLACDALILGTPTLGQGELPGLSTGLPAASWEEFLPQLAGVDLKGKRIALYGLGDQIKYPDEFADAMRLIYERVIACGASVVGFWSTSGYSFNHSRAVIGERFVGLALDQHNQAMQTEARVDAWLADIRPQLILN
jgi:flavodoxin I